MDPWPWGSGSPVVGMCFISTVRPRPSPPNPPTFLAVDTAPLSLFLRRPVDGSQALTLQAQSGSFR